MRSKLTLSLLLCLSSIALFAQNPFSVKGSVMDTSAIVKLAKASVCVLNAKDSTLYKFTRVVPDGSFSINNLKSGKYILMVTFPDYADYIEYFHLDSAKREVDFGKISMTLKSKLLREVMIRGTKDAIKIKGDTTEFSAAGFVIQPNAKVEDLLKQLPGIEVDKDGKITAQGQAVNKVLVDGEEFFGDDPTLVTKNIRADMVDKVQLYDKKSDQATFTGIDDGVKNKTLNIKLKEDKKNGYFGKVSAGIGTDGYYEGTGAFNVFKGKKRFSVYGTAGNDGTTGLSWDDSNKYTGSNDNMSFSDDGGIYFYGGGDDLYYNGQGIPISRTGGAHYDEKWDSDKQSINANYKTGYLNIKGINENLVQYNLPTYIQTTNSTLDYDNSSFKQKLDGTYQLKIDSLSNLKISVDGTIKNVQNHSTSISSTYHGTGFDTLINHSNKVSSSNSDQKILNASIFYNKKFKKVGRSFSVNISEAYNENKSTAYLNAVTQFYHYPTGALDSMPTINQYKPSTVTSNNLTSNITYSEPFTKKFAVVVNYGTGLNNSTSDKESFDMTPATGEYDKLNNQLSNNYKFDQFSNQLGAVFNYRGAKTVLTFGTKATDVSYQQTNLVNNSLLKRSFLNWSPQAQYVYRFTQQKTFSFYYNGSTTQPSISQIQPVIDNSDNLNVTVGNPDLKPAFRNNFNTYYNSYRVLSGLSIYVGSNFSFTSNSIVSNTTIDQTGKNTILYSNLTNKTPFNWNIFSGLNQKIKPLDNISLGLSANLSGSTSYNYSNGALNETRSVNYTGRIGLSKSVEKKFDIYTSIAPTYTISSSSLQPDINNNGINWNGYASANFYLPAKTEIGANVNYTFKGATTSFNQNLQTTAVSAHVDKKFLAEQNLKLSLACNDLLNQNVGFSRTFSGTTFTQSTYPSIKRYFMFSVTYDFSQMGGASKPKN